MTDAVTVRKYPTRPHCRCPQCGHQGQVKAFIDRPPKLKCSRCGSRDAVVVDRDRSRACSARARARSMRRTQEPSDTIH
jgi:hypothetical protein